MRTFAIVAAISALAGATSLEPGSRLWVEGTSTVKDYRCDAGVIESTLATRSDADLARAVESARVSIPLAQLDCHNGKMNDHMRKALKANENPSVVFELGSYTVNGSEAVLNAALTIAGTTREVQIPAAIVAENGALRVKASKQIDMTEWGVKPPSLMMGTMKVKDNVTINFDVALKP